MLTCPSRSYVCPAQVGYSNRGRIGTRCPRCKRLPPSSGAQTGVLPYPATNATSLVADGTGSHPVLGGRMAPLTPISGNQDDPPGSSLAHDRSPFQEPRARLRHGGARKPKDARGLARLDAATLPDERRKRPHRRRIAPALGGSRRRSARGGVDREARGIPPPLRAALAAEESHLRERADVVARGRVVHAKARGDRCDTESGLACKEREDRLARGRGRHGGQTLRRAGRLESPRRPLPGYVLFACPPGGHVRLAPRA